MKIKAKFKGSNSLGYVNGENYDLEFKTDSQGSQDFIMIRHIDKINSPGHWTMRRNSECYYQSLKAFLNNWQVF